MSLRGWATLLNQLITFTHRHRTVATGFVHPVFFKANDVLNYLTLTEFVVYTSVKLLFVMKIFWGVRELMVVEVVPQNNRE